MSTTILLPGPVAAPTPDEFASYLHLGGWQLRADDDRWLQFARPDLPADALLRVPQLADAPDYGRRAAILLGDLARFEGREEIEVLRSIRASSSDVLEFRLVGPGLAAGLASVQAAHEAHQAIRDMLLAATRSVERPAPSYRGRPTAKALAPLRLFHFAPARAGSYVLTVEANVPPRLAIWPNDERQPQIVAAEEPASRQALIALTRALHATATATRRATAAPSVDPFVEQVPAGVSANLCTALANLLAGTEASSIEATTRFAACRPTAGPVPSASRFRAADAQVLREAAMALLRFDSERQDQEITGTVTGLHRASPGLGGDATLSSASNPARHVRVELDQDTYGEAVRAHVAGHRVRCVGRLVHEGRRRWLRDVRCFEVLGETGRLEF